MASGAGRPDEAHTALERARAAFEQSGRPGAVAYVHQFQAETYLDQGREQEAVAALELALAGVPAAVLAALEHLAARRAEDEELVAIIEESRAQLRGDRTADN